jgi:serine/threonine protein kinase
MVNAFWKTGQRYRFMWTSGSFDLKHTGIYFYTCVFLYHSSYNHKSDMWALGCVLYEMCTLHVPFNAKDFDSLVVKIMTGQFTPLPR